MAGLQEQPRWESEVYRIEENDPVHGGENGITNKPIKQLANRTNYLKQELEKPATTEQVGRVQLDSSTDSTSETKAATPKAVKTVKDLADSNARSLQNVIPNSKKSNSVTSTSSDTVATSYAVKQAYDKGVEAKTIAEGKYTAQDATTSQKGITQLDSSTNSTSETRAATPKAVKTVKDLADSNARSLQNVIQNSKKSNSVTSTSSDTVATSYAVKTANDNANNRVSKSGDTINGDVTIKHNTRPKIYFYRADIPMVYLGGLDDSNPNDVTLYQYQGKTRLTLRNDKLESNKLIYINNDPVVYEKTARVDNLNSLTGSLFFKCDGTTTGMPSGWERTSDHNGFQVDGGWQRFQVVVQNENKIAIRVNDSNGDATSWSAWSELVTEGNFGQRIKILTGTIAHGGTIPLPAGFTERQCRWFVSPHTMHDDVSAKDIMFFQVSAENTRVVTCLVEGKVSQKSKASYIIIGVK